MFSVYVMILFKSFNKCFAEKEHTCGFKFPLHCYNIKLTQNDKQPTIQAYLLIICYFKDQSSKDKNLLGTNISCCWLLKTHTIWTSKICQLTIIEKKMNRNCRRPGIIIEILGKTKNPPMK